jgi:hypothetical protein
VTQRGGRAAAIERASADAPPCRLCVDDDGWRLRFNDGITRRRNSVFPERPGRAPLPAKIARSEAFYLELRALAGWGLARGARETYLQVHPAREAAQAVYRSVGYATDHEFTYREAPA